MQGGFQEEVLKVRQNLSSIGQADLQMMTSFKTPPKAVEACMAGVLILLGQDNLTWPNISQKMKESGFVNKLIGLNFDDVPLALFQKLELHIKTHPEAFDLASLMQVSMDCGTFAKWVMLSQKFYQMQYPEQHQGA